MRWVTYESAGGPRCGLVEGDEIRGLAAGRSLLDLLGDGGERLAAAADEARRRPDEVRPLDGRPLLAPIPRPPSVRDMICFLEHLRRCAPRSPLQMIPEWDQFPGFYFSNPAAVVGPSAPVAVPPGSAMFDFELSAAAVIGREGADLDPETAADHVAGYTVFCDWSARDHQLREMRLGLGPVKGKDSANSLGPMLVTPDELAPFRSGPSFHLRMSASVNGEEVGSGWLDTMDWSFGEVIAYASRGTRVVPGDVLAVGTVPTGCLFERYAADPDGFGRWLEPGDRVRLEVDQLGALDHEIVAGAAVRPLRTGC